MWYFVDVRVVPQQVYPGDIHFVIEFVEKFEEQGFVMDFEVDHSKPTFIFGSTDHVPRSERSAFVTLLGFLSPEATSSYFVQNLKKLGWKFESAHGKDKK